MLNTNNINFIVIDISSCKPVQVEYNTVENRITEDYDGSSSQTIPLFPQNKIIVYENMKSRRHAKLKAPWNIVRTIIVDTIG